MKQLTDESNVVIMSRTTKEDETISKNEIDGQKQSVDCESTQDESKLIDAKDEEHAAGNSESNSASKEDADDVVGEEGEEDDVVDKLNKARSEAVENYDRYLRTAAELDNFRKRAVRMRAESREETLRDLLLQIAPLMDNMRRALAQESDETQSLKQGVELILSGFQTVLGGYGLEEIDAIGLEFDPNHHEAMLEIESKDHAPGTVVEEMEKGYRLKDKVLRPSRVVVSKFPVDEEGSKDSDSSK